MSYTHWVDHDHRVMSCVVRWDKTWTPTLDALHVLHGIITGATTARSPGLTSATATLAVQWHPRSAVVPKGHHHRCLRGTIIGA